MSITPASRKATGRRLQNWVAERLSKLLNIPHGRDKDIQGREMGQAGTDVKLYGKAAELFPFSIECKNQETWAVPAWMKQAKENENEGTNWLIVCKKNGVKPIIILDAEVFFKLYKKIIKEK